MPPPHTLPHPATTAPAGAVLITGASTGIGAAAAVALAECGYFVFAGVRAPAREVPLVAACGGPARAAALRLDVADPASIAAATLTIATALESAGGPSPAAPPRRLAALVNNAGVSFPGPLLAQPPGELDATLAVNLVGALAVTRAVGPLLGIADAAGVPGLGPAWRRAPGSAASKGTRLPAPALAPLPPLAPPTHGRGRPVIINVSSVAGKVAGPYMGAYAASKHGLEGASDALRREVAPFGVEVVVLGERERERERDREREREREKMWGGRLPGTLVSREHKHFLHTLSSLSSLSHAHRTGRHCHRHLGESRRPGRGPVLTNRLGGLSGHVHAPDGAGGPGGLPRAGCGDGDRGRHPAGGAGAGRWWRRWRGARALLPPVVGVGARDPPAAPGRAHPTQVGGVDGSPPAAGPGDGLGGQRPVWAERVRGEEVVG